jgi:hypothetical protein
MVRGGRAEAPVRRSDVSFRLDQKTGNFKVAVPSRQMQWSLSSVDVSPRLYISVALQQKTANFKVAILNRVKQWSVSPTWTEESKRMNLRKQSFAS